jgi:signal transduction protein with GAF and PtsI domain
VPRQSAAGEAVGAKAGRTRLVVKPHPAETEAVYADALGATTSTALAPPGLDLAGLVAACDLVVTVNSTVAIDAMALGIPALAVGMPNNLTPIVVDGGITGVYHRSELEPALDRLLWNDAERAVHVARGLACAEAGGMRADGSAAARAAAALAGLAAPARIRPL